MKEKDLFILSIVGSLTLGLAPFVPHAHIWKQIMNIVHSRPMAGLDWFDLVLHGTPWLVFIVLGIRKLAGKAKW